MHAVVGLIEIDGDAPISDLFEQAPLAAGDPEAVVGRRNRVQEILEQTAQVAADLDRLVAELDQQTLLLAGRIAQAKFAADHLL